MGHIYQPSVVRQIIGELASLRLAGRHEAAEQLKARYTRRMYNLSEYVKSLKQGFSMSYNRRHQRQGTLWESRFKSVLVEGSRRALWTVAAYIDLNAVRAGLVNDPQDYRFCGYAEAVAGNHCARTGLLRVMQTLDGASGAWSRFKSSRWQ